MPIKCIQPRLAVVGRIKIGGLGAARPTRTGDKTWQPPVKYDHFQVTRMDRGPDGNFVRDESIHEAIGDQPTEIPVTLLYNDIELNFRSELAMYDGKTCSCRGDGETAVDVKTGECRQCPCPMLDAKKCKPHGTLQVLMADAQICGGVWQFSTTSWNTIVNIESSLKFLAHVAGGKIAGIPLIMRLFKKACVIEGKASTINVVGLFFRGNPVALLEAALQKQQQLIQAGIQMEQLEYRAKAELEKTPKMPVDEDLVDEFHPEEEERPSIGDLLPKTPAPVAPVAPAPAAPVAPTVPAQTGTYSPPAEYEAKPAKNETKTTEPETKPAKTETKPAEPETKPAETASAPAETKTKAQVVAEIMRMRGRKKVMGDVFQKLLTGAGVASSNPATWEQDQALRILSAIENLEVAA